MKAKVKTIDIAGKQWFDRVNGYSYFSARITTNYGMKSEKTYFLPFQYGYGDAYIDASLKYLCDLNIIKSKFLVDLDSKIITRYHKITGCTKREVIEFGGN